MSDQQLIYVKQTMERLTEVTRAGWMLGGERHRPAVDTAIRDLLDEVKTLASMYFNEKDLCENCNELQAQLAAAEDRIAFLRAPLKFLRDQFTRDLEAALEEERDSQ